MDYNNLQPHEKAALIYLHLFQLIEGPNEADDEEDLLDIIQKADPLLRELGFPPPGTYIYDNDGEPQIRWPEGFSYEEFVSENIQGYDPIITNFPQQLLIS